MWFVTIYFVRFAAHFVAVAAFGSQLCRVASIVLFLWFVVAAIVLLCYFVQHYYTFCTCAAFLSIEFFFWRTSTGYIWICPSQSVRLLLFGFHLLSDQSNAMQNNQNAQRLSVRALIRTCTYARSLHTHQKYNEENSGEWSKAKRRRRRRQRAKFMVSLHDNHLTYINFSDIKMRSLRWLIVMEVWSIGKYIAETN